MVFTKQNGVVGSKRVRRVKTLWKKNDTIKLIKLYEINRHMWDRMNEFYKTKQVRRKTMEEIARALNRDLSDCQNKWNSLRVQFNCELKKRSTASTHDAVLPQWEHFHKMGFLLSNVNPRTNLSEESPGGKDESTISQDSACNDQSIQFENASLFCADIALSDCQPFLDPSIKIEDENTVAGDSTSTRDAAGKEEEMNVDRPDSNEGTPTHHYHYESKRDSCQIFGDFVAEQLRMVLSKDRAKLQRAIQRTILAYTTPPEEKEQFNAMFINGNL